MLRRESGVQTEPTLLQRFLIVSGIFFSLLLAGTVGYVLIEGWGWRDALYMTIITVSTVGFGEVRPMSDAGRLFTTGLIVSGVGAAAYMFSSLANYIVAGELRGVLRRQRMQNRINQLEDHYIVCGYGRVGIQVAQELLQNQVDLVVIDVDADRSEEIEANGLLMVVGDATEDAVLSQAGIERAAGLCACLPSDAGNVFVTLTARTLNPNLVIIARSNTLDSERKLGIAGADHVINPYSISGHRMARQLIHPNVVEFMDVVMRRGQLQILIEEIRVSTSSVLHDKSLAQYNVRQRTGANVLAVSRPGGRTFTDINSDFVILAGDTLIALGTPEQLERLADLAEYTKKQRRSTSAD